MNNNGTPMGDPNNLSQLFEDLNPSGYVQTLFPDRPYDGQPHTHTGERGRVEVHGLTMRDIRDCFIAGCFEASGLHKTEYPRSIRELPWHNMNIMTVCQVMLCNIEKKMGIYPNVPGGMCDAKR